MDSNVLKVTLYFMIELCHNSTMIGVSERVSPPQKYNVKYNTNTLQFIYFNFFSSKFIMHKYNFFLVPSDHFPEVFSWKNETLVVILSLQNTWTPTMSD